MAHPARPGCIYDSLLRIKNVAGFYHKQKPATLKIISN